MKLTFKFLVSVLSLFLISCKSNLLVLEDLVPSARQQNFNVSFSQSSLTDFSLNLNLSYEIRNPYKKDLPVPDHTMGILLNEITTDLLSEHKSVTVPAKSSKVLEYTFKLDFGTLQTLLGKNNKITFLSSIEMDLSDYSDMLPNYTLAVSKDFNLDASDLKPKIDDLLRKRLGKYTFELEHSTYVKIPSPPSITLSSAPMEIRLLGDGINTINPNEIKEALIPFGDLLVNGELDGLKDPFIDAIINTSVTIPTPTVTEWNKTTDIKMEDQVVNLLRPMDPQIDAKWNDAKSKMYLSTSIPVANYLIDNFLDPLIDSDATEKWNMFQGAYNELKTTVLPDELPGPQTRGFELAIPISFKNNNEFPISVPIFRSSVFVTGGQPFSIYIKPENLNEIPLDNVPSNTAIIEAKQMKKLYIVFSFDMQAFNQGIYSLFMKKQFEPNLKGIVSYDFGYGPMYVGYDLEKLKLNYK